VRVFVEDECLRDPRRFHFRYHAPMPFQAIIAAPFGKIAIRCSDEDLLGIEFVSSRMKLLAPTSPMAREICDQLSAYFANAAFEFDLPFMLDGTHHQCLVWQALLDIPCGETLTYGELAQRMGSSARAVGQACGGNPIPIVIPCHRVVSASGLGGFMRHAEGDALDIKRWLLAHES